MKHYIEHITPRQSKFLFLAVLLCLPMVGHAPAIEDTRQARLASSGYYKVMPFKAIYSDQFHVYIFDLAERREVKNYHYLKPNYNETQYFLLDRNDIIIDIQPQ